MLSATASYERPKMEITDFMPYDLNHDNAY